MSIRNFINAPCENCGCDTIHYKQLCRECGEPLVTNGAARKEAFRAFAHRMRFDKNYRNSILASFKKEKVQRRIVKLEEKALIDRQVANAKRKGGIFGKRHLTR